MKIKTNENETQAIIFPFNKSPKRIPSIQLSVEGVEIPLLDAIKYLGIELDKQLSLRHHVPKICERAIKCGTDLFPLLSRKSTLNYENKALYRVRQLKFFFIN